MIIEADSLVDLLIEEIDYRLALEADSLVACEREIDRFTDRQSDVSRQIIALTASLQQTHQIDLDLNRVELNLMTQIVLTRLIHKLERKEIEQIVFTRLLHKNELILKQFTKILYH